MYKKFVQLSAMAAAAQAADANGAKDHWAVIVVGSAGYMNYRHHADGCHAYQQAKAGGIPEDQIIMLAYDDVAQSGSNPYPGKLFNKPTKQGTPGVDVYKGCKIDYKGSAANKKNLLAALKGDTSVKKALKSNANSKIFFSYFDHGAPGLVGMPSGGYLYANELIEAFNFMYENKMYDELVMYMEACESGSMFAKLPKNQNIYALSAANAHESSWGTYCSPNDEVDGKRIGSCLGDLFSVNWMEDLDAAVKAK
jgi:legumain